MNSLSAVRPATVRRVARCVAASAWVFALGPAVLHAQALTNLTSLLVAYNSRKVVANPTGELKARLDSLERDLFAFNRAGDTAQVRRLFAKGNALLSNIAWTDTLDFAASLLIRTDRAIVESQQPWSVRLQEMYQPTFVLAHAPTVRVVLRKRPIGAGANMQLGAVVKDFGARDVANRDLKAAPFGMQLDLHDVADGNYTLYTDVLDGATSLARPSLSVTVRKGIDEEVTSLETAAKNAPEAVRAELLFPGERMRKVNSSVLTLNTFDAERDFGAAEAVLVAVRAGKDPYAGRTGDIKRHYLLEAANEIMPYRIYIPTTYVPTKPMPLIIALHGLGGTEDSFFDQYGRRLPQLAEAQGYIVAAPLGYRVDGSYGWGVGTPPTDPATRRREEFAEADVMQVLALVRKIYSVDESRIYLMGHSMGAIGTWKIAPKYPGVWAALAAFSGQGAPATMEQMKGIPEFVVHGDNDATVNVAGSRTMVAAAKALGTDVKYIEVPGGSHTNVVEPNFEGMFEWFTGHRKAVRVAP